MTMPEVIAYFLTIKYNTVLQVLSNMGVFLQKKLFLTFNF